MANSANSTKPSPRSSRSDLLLARLEKQFLEADALYGAALDAFDIAQAAVNEAEAKTVELLRQIAAVRPSGMSGFRVKRRMASICGDVQSSLMADLAA